MILEWRKKGFKQFEFFMSEVRGDQRIWNYGMWSPLWYRFFYILVQITPYYFRTLKTHFFHQNNDFGVKKKGFKQFEFFMSEVRGDQRIWNYGMWSPLLWYRFFYILVQITPYYFRMLKTHFFHQNNDFGVKKKGFKQFEFFMSEVRGDQRIWNYGMWSTLWYRFFYILVQITPYYFRMLKTNFFHQNNDFGVKKKCFKQFEFFMSEVRWDQRIWNYGMWSPPLWYRFFIS